ncbi:MAG: type II toxin-antitoxin system Phd/YefM family antitoxin [Treponema sp.]|nr:type II toxin-antitoxin system Phd/YefM family antitoxin [Treponema sp.]
MIHAFVPISRLNKGEAGKIIDEVKADGVRVIVKNNVPECVMVSVEEYDRIMKLASRPVKIIQTPEEEARRKAFIQRIRQNVPPPIPPQADRKTIKDEIGPIEVDEEAVLALRRLG